MITDAVSIFYEKPPLKIAYIRKRNYIVITKLLPQTKQTASANEDENAMLTERKCLILSFLIS